MSTAILCASTYGKKNTERTTYGFTDLTGPSRSCSMSFRMSSLRGNNDAQFSHFSLQDPEIVTPLQKNCNVYIFQAATVSYHKVLHLQHTLMPAQPTLLHVGNDAESCWEISRAWHIMEAKSIITIPIDLFIFPLPYKSQRPTWKLQREHGTRNKAEADVIGKANKAKWFWVQYISGIASILIEDGVLGHAQAPPPPPPNLCGRKRWKRTTYICKCGKIHSYM